MIPLTIVYKNWKGEIGIRKIVPSATPYYGSNEWHKEPQWLLDAVDVEKGERRTFAMKDIFHME